MQQKKRWQRLTALILAGGMVLAALGALGTAYAIWSSRGVTLRQWQNRLAAATHMLTAHAVQTLDGADIMLRAARDNLEKAELFREPDFRATISTYGMHVALRESIFGLQQVNEIFIIGNDGNIINHTRQFPPPPINFTDQDYFQAFAENPNLEFFISGVNSDLFTQEPCFYLARPIRSASGEKLGLILVGLPSSFFSSFYQAAILENLDISLIRRDGAILSHILNVKELVSGKNQMSSDIMSRMRNAERGLHFIGGLNTRFSFDEMLFFQLSPVLPIGMSVVVSRDEILSAWKQQSINFAILGGSMSSLLIILTLILARLIKQLEQTRNAALSAAEAKTRFITTISHELRTPMNAIVGGAHQLRSAELKPDDKHLLQIVSSSAQQLNILLNDILDFTHFDARQFRIELEPFNPRLLAQNAMDMARVLAPHTKLELITQVDSSVPDLILGDANRIKQIILNLLINAIKYTNHGKVELCVSYLRIDWPLLILQVIDTGPGISTEDQARVFEPFERTAWAKHKPGTGLGLTICKKLTEAMSGSINLHSKIGQGTHFTVEIPAPEPQSNMAEPDLVASNAPTFRILVAEDVAPSRMLLTLMLEKMGHQVTAVENGLEAFLIANETPFDLILMDLQMPEMDGMTATRRIRTQRGLNHATHIWAVSAHVDVTTQHELKEAGFDDALLKPVKAERLSFVLSALRAQA